MRNLCCMLSEETVWTDDVHDSCEVNFYKIQMPMLSILKLIVGTFFSFGLAYGTLYRHYRVTYLASFIFDDQIMDLHGSSWRMLTMHWKGMVLTVLTLGLWSLTGYSQLDLDSYVDKQLKWRHKHRGGKDFELKYLAKSVTA